MAEQPTAVTPVSLSDAAGFLRSALRAQFPVESFTRDACLFLLAQLWIESARGRSVHNNNPGNLSSNGTSGDYWRPPWYPEPTSATSPRYRDLHAKMLKGEAPRAFLSFATMADGFNMYVTWLRTKFPSIINAAQSGNASAVAHAIRISGYCPDCEENATAESLSGLVAEFQMAGVFASGTAPPEHLDALRTYTTPAQAPRLLPVLRVGDTGPAVALARAASGFDHAAIGPDHFTTAFRDYLREHVGRVFYIDDAIGPKTWSWIILYAGARLVRT